MATTITVKEFAAKMGVSVQAVHKAINQRRLVKSVRKSKNGIVLDSKLAVTEWQDTLQRPSRSKVILGDAVVGGGESRRPAEPPIPQNAPEPADDDTQKIKKLANIKNSIAVQQLYKAKLTQLEFEKRSGKLKSAELVNRELFALGKILKENLLNIPDRISAEIASMTDRTEVHNKLTQEIKICLNDLIEGIRKSQTLSVE